MMILEIIEYLENHEELAKDIMEQLDGYDDFLADNRWYPMSELDELLYGVTSSDIVNMVYYGSINPNDEYVRFDGYGNLESSDNVDYSDLIGEYFVNEILNNFSKIRINDNNLKFMLNALKEE